MFLLILVGTSIEHLFCCARLPGCFLTRQIRKVDILCTKSDRSELFKVLSAQTDCNVPFAADSALQKYYATKAHKDRLKSIVKGPMLTSIEASDRNARAQVLENTLLYYRVCRHSFGTNANLVRHRATPLHAKRLSRPRRPLSRALSGIAIEHLLHVQLSICPTSYTFSTATMTLLHISLNQDFAPQASRHYLHVIKHYDHHHHHQYDHHRLSSLSYHSYWPSYLSTTYPKHQHQL